MLDQTWPDADEAAPPLPLPLPPVAGHAMVAWGSRLLVLGGHMKVGRLQGVCEGCSVNATTTSTPGCTRGESQGGWEGRMLLHPDAQQAWR